MRHPSRYLIGYAAGELKPSRQRAVEKHLHGCRSCREALAQEEAVRARLHAASTPDPSKDLCERILQRSAAARAGTGDADFRLAQAEGDRRRRSVEGFLQHHRSRLAVGGGVTVVAVATLTAAYALGSEVQPHESVVAGQTASVTESFQTVAAGTPTTLTAGQVEQLRDEGWFCPELHSLGFQLVNASALTVDGQPTLQLELSDGTHSLTVYEQRTVNETGTGIVPVNAATGNSVIEDGFERIGGPEQTVWLHPGRAWQLVIDSGSATYTVVSSLPVSDMPRAVSQLILTERSQLAYSRPDVPNDPVSRILRGLGKLAQPAP
ncbi:hypothetical protein GC088_10645 [Arthrobacter sp. JZ12]|uniref:anti-sigma factor family protein n=1 Tax=Arthrobacter sp. JZ12 TaxID=2654190 RepID=UPI002B49B7A5|nr:zf-HC2 domain-containing protein [Arthrobacter sp. JZ12]WRH25475.1 hypothetical protein GC088_10645 [Arthrobacter sp. JZ12]